MKFITHIARLLVGLLFIFSGLIKLNDPVGFSFKLNDYFAADVLNLPFFQPLTLELALFIVILEVLLGLALLLGSFKKFTVWMLLGMIVFFTFLTFYSAYFNKVTDCGCFGDAIPLTPWESFGKDVILTVLILILFVNQRYIQPILSPKANAGILTLGLLACAFFGNHVLNHLPLGDFRPYAEGMSITEGMQSAQELGLEPTQYATRYYLRHTKSGEEMNMLSDRYMAEEWWKRKEWEILPDRSESVVVKEGYEPPIHDFVITLEGREVTKEILEAPAVFLMIAYKMEKSHPEAYPHITAFARDAREASIPFVGITASLPAITAEYVAQYDLNFPLASMDETALKTIIRSNPGVLLLKEGRVIKKWHYRDLPDFETVQAEQL